MKTGQPYMALVMVSKESNSHRKVERYGIIKIPTDHNISRFLELPEQDGKHYIMFLEDVIMQHIDAIFPGYKVKNSYSLKLTRDADMEYDDYEGEDLIDAIDRIRSVRSVGKPNRFQFDRAMPEKLLDYLTSPSTCQRISW
jgi:polyphosphate kinase